MWTMVLCFFKFLKISLNSSPTLIKKKVVKILTEKFNWLQAVCVKEIIGDFPNLTISTIGANCNGRRLFYRCSIQMICSDLTLVMSAAVLNVIMIMHLMMHMF